MTQRRRVVIVGGGHAGGRLAQLLSRQSDRVDVTMVGAETTPPYERPPLSKAILLGVSGLDDCLLWKPGDPAWEQVKIRLGVSVEEIDRRRREVRLSDGTTLEYDRLVLANGSRVRKFTVQGADIEGVLTLRTYPDALEVSKHFLTSSRMIVVGGGFIGLEVAAAAAQRGLTPRVIEASNRLLSRLAPKLVADRLAETHQRAGVILTYGTMVQRFVANGRGALKRAVLTTGEVVDCDLALVAVGVEPEINLAVAAGLDVDVGIATDQQLRTSDPHIFACGDVAAFWHPLYNQRIRLESWQNAEDHAKILASVLLEEDEIPTPAVPFFWSDQYDLSLQILGLPHLGSSTRRTTSGPASAILLHCDALDRIVGATGLGPTELIGRELRRTRRLIASGAMIEGAALGGAELEVLAD